MARAQNKSGGPNRGKKLIRKIGMGSGKHLIADKKKKQR